MDPFIIKGKISDREVDILKRDVDHYSKFSIRGEVGKEGNYDPSLRKCKLFFADASQYPSTFNILQSTIIESYQSIYKEIDYSNISSVQYVSYKEGDFFRRHSDVMPYEWARMLTTSININDPHEYDGGDLLIYSEKGTERLERDRGSFVVFPAFIEHECTKITRGTRHAIVTWTEGPAFMLKGFFDHYKNNK